MLENRSKFLRTYYILYFYECGKICINILFQNSFKIIYKQKAKIFELYFNKIKVFVNLCLF